jgi:hypothetical protein
MIEQEQSSLDLQYQNSLAEIARIRNEISEIQTQKASRLERIAHLQQQYQELAGGVVQAERRRETKQIRLDRQQALMQIAVGTPDEQLCSDALASMQESLQDASNNLDLKQREKADAQQHLELIPLLQEEIESLDGRLATQNHAQTVMEALQGEIWQALGLAKMHHLLARLDEEREQYQEAQRLQRESRDRYEQLLKSIAELNGWRNLRDQFYREHRELEPKDKYSPVEHVLRAYIEFVRTLGKYGPACAKKIVGHDVVALIDLNMDVLTTLMGHNPRAGNPWWKVRRRNDMGIEQESMVTREIEIIEHLLEKCAFERKEHYGYQIWQ